LFLHGWRLGQGAGYLVTSSHPVVGEKLLDPPAPVIAILDAGRRVELSHALREGAQSDPIGVAGK